MCASSIFSCVTLLFCFSLQARTTIEKLITVDFDSSMQHTSWARIVNTQTTERYIGIPGQTLYTFFKKLYKKNAKQKNSRQLRIPKTIHFIWLGGPLPTVFESYINSWRENHQDWDVILWTDEDVAALELQNQIYFDRALNYGQKSDIARYEILYQYGGVYVDVDFECFRSLDILHHTYDFYTALLPLDTRMVNLGNGIIGSIPGHPILKECIATIKNNCYQKTVPAKTGPTHFTKAFYACADKGDHRDIAFPAGYFYPLMYRDRKYDKDKWIKNGAFAVHHWAHSWMPAEHRPKKFSHIKNADRTRGWYL